MATANSKLKIDFGYDSLGTSNVNGDLEITGSLAIGGNLAFSGTTLGNFIPDQDQRSLGNTSNRWNLQGYVANIASTLTVAGPTSLSDTLVVTKTIDGGNTTITGFANVTTSVNAASHTIGSTMIANTSGVYHTGVVNAASHTTSGIVANTSGVYPVSNSTGTALGSSTERWIINANTGNLSGDLTVTGNTTVNNATLNGTVQTISGNSSFDSGVLFVDSVNNRVGINNTAPTVSLEVSGSANVSTNVNAASFSVGTALISNTSGVYHTGVVNAASHITSGIVANTSGVYPVSNSTGTALGSSTERWIINANTANFSGNVTIGSGGGIIANGTIGTSGQALLSNGSSVYWTFAYGPQGAVGAQGAQGFQGVQGTNGTNGAQGTIGAQGAQGRQGFDGVQGAVGAQGAQGRQGAQGFQGVIGAQGAQGAQGTVGTVGAQGAAGGFSTGSNAQVNSLGINTAASGSAGEIRATGNITAGYSDDRLKNKLGPILNALDKVNHLSGFYYEPNDLAISLGYQSVRDVGVSAQEVNAVQPETVTDAPVDNKYLTVRYERLIPLLIEAIKELKSEVDDLKNQMNEIKNGNKS